MCIPLGISTVLMFSAPTGLTGTFQLTHMFLTYNLVSTVFYTAVSLPYSTLQGLMTTNQYERGLLGNFRFLCADRHDRGRNRVYTDRICGKQRDDGGCMQRTEGYGIRMCGGNGVRTSSGFYYIRAVAYRRPGDRNGQCGFIFQHEDRFRYRYGCYGMDPGCRKLQRGSVRRRGSYVDHGNLCLGSGDLLCGCGCVHAGL